jgi:hypothetical protein
MFSVKLSVIAYVSREYRRMLRAGRLYLYRDTRREGTVRRLSFDTCLSDVLSRKVYYNALDIGQDRHL